jgi:LmbE family N-acetylglucosaminyl deacetylase
MGAHDSSATDVRRAWRVVRPWLRRSPLLRAVRLRSIHLWHRADRQLLWFLGGVARALQRRGHRPTPRWFAPGTGGGALVIVAHPDDDLLFLSPDILSDLRSGTPFTTVYVTSGDSGRGGRYLRCRERGVAAAYARMVGVVDEWSVARVLVAGRTCVQVRLRAAPQVSLVFLRLPDGVEDGRGTLRSGRASLQGLLLGETGSLRTAAHPAEPYSHADLDRVLGRLMEGLRPRSIRTLDCVGEFGDGDHSDHHAVARFVHSARERHFPAARLLSFAGYPVQDLPPNVRPPELTEKIAALAVYAAHDPLMVDPRAACEGRPEPVWLLRQYVLLDLPGVRDAQAS